MNIEVSGRIRPLVPGEGKENLSIEGTQRLTAPGGHFFHFQNLFRRESTTYDIFRNSVELLLEMLMSGFNVCLLVTGESGSGKSYTMAGESSARAGLVQMVFDYLFAKLMEDTFKSDTKTKRKNPKVYIQMYEIYNEMVKKLLEVPQGQSVFSNITESADKGIHVRKAMPVHVKDAGDANLQFRSGWGRRTEASTDYGPAQNNAAILLNIDLHMNVGESSLLSKSRLTIVELPGLEKLGEDPSHIRLREGPTLSKALLSLHQVTTSLASNPFPDRVISYSESKLTQLLREELGGNCKTRALVCLKPVTTPETLTAVIKFVTNLSQIKNFPILNDNFAQSLQTQYRARIIDMETQVGVGPNTMMAQSVGAHLGDAKDEVRRLQSENLVLKDQNDRLAMRLDQMTAKFNALANTKTDLSKQLLMSEEEKLKVSQSLVEMQIENNKVREDTEAGRFELTNKIITLENQLMTAEAERDKHMKSAKNAKERLNEMEQDRKDLADEYVTLKSNYLALTNEHQQEVARNETLAVELLNLVNAKATLMRQLLILTNGDPKIGNPDAEIDRIKAIVTKYSSGRVKADQILSTQRDRDVVAESLLSSRKRHQTDLDRIRNEYGDQSATYEKRITGLIKELQDARNLARDRQHKISEINAKLITLKGDKEMLETQCNRLQHKVKDQGEDFRLRLIKYVEDIADYVDKGSGVPGEAHVTKMREYADGMMKDIKRSHREREDQLSHAAQSFKARLKKANRRYEEALVAHWNLRQTCENRGIDTVDMGPDALAINLTDGEIQSAHLKEIGRLQSELNNYRNDLDGLKVKFGVFDRDGKVNLGDWNNIRKHLREYTLTTQQNLEDERARLMSENNVLREQLQESQSYIDNRLARYKQEIVKLRHQLGIKEDALLMTERSLSKVRTRRK
ncbi:coiled-coil domain-containing protein 78-like isoform X2 [Haliotis rufescens]|uniref:coiled-coil domain-containing protein 78-like isoform X2 n=1 Tax=Haliotis rufescens TaxID=6454 RepID=UPI00201EA9AC|nr:coiled-coil domain-containing protein 78-like isoform X2 [Haliotis rufescens]